MESQDSSSPMVTRAVAAVLNGEEPPSYAFPAWQQVGLKAIGRLPKEVALWLVPKLYAPGALDPAQVTGLDVQNLVRERLDDYRTLSGRFPAVTLGIAMGGTTSHLALSLRGPFLPQAFVLTLKGGSERGDVKRYFNRAFDLARSIAESNPDVLTIQHYDPVHDGWLTRTVNHLRIKLLDLPQAYKEFLRERLEPGGEVCYLEGQARWLRYRVGPRSVFQVGGWGDISAREFLDGSTRLANYARREGLRSMRWPLDDYPLEEGPESEWGSEPGLGEALEDFCQKEGFRFRRIAFEDPNDFSRLAFWGAKRQIEKSGNEPAGTLVEMFSQFDPSAVLKVGVPPDLAAGVIAALVEGFREAHPGVRLAPAEIWTADQVAALAGGTIDVGLVRHPVNAPGLGFGPMLVQPQGVLLAESDPLARAGELHLADLAGRDLLMPPGEGEPGMHAETLAECRRHGYVPGQVHEGAGLGLVLAGMAVAFAPGTPGADVPGLAWRPLLGSPIAYRVSTAWRAETAEVRDFSALAVRILKERAGMTDEAAAPVRRVSRRPGMLA